MTLVMMDGFETYGDGTETGTTVQDRIISLDDTGNTYRDRLLATAGTPGNLSLATGYDAIGLALEFPVMGGSQGQRLQYMFPSSQRSESPFGGSGQLEYVVGFRFYNGFMDNGTFGVTRTLWNVLVGSSFTDTTPSFAGGASLRLNDDRTLTFIPAAGGTVDSTESMEDSTWYHVEIQYFAGTNASGGYAKVFVNDEEWIDIPSVDIITNFSYGLGFSIGCLFNFAGNTDGAAEGVMYDDLYCIIIDGVEHTERLGPLTRVIRLAPDSDETPNDWAPSTGSDNFAMVDNTDWDNTTYVEATTTGDDDHYGLEPYDSALKVEAVNGMQIDVVCEATDGTPNLHIGFDNGTDDSVDIGTIATGSETYMIGVFGDNPSGGDWTVSALSSIEATLRMTE